MIKEQMKVVRAARKQKVAKIGKAYSPSQLAGKRGGTSSSRNRTMKRLMGW